MLQAAGRGVRIHRLQFLLASGGFVMVACAELSKIPLATFFVQSASRRAKLATLGFLLLMSFITFETIFFSLERGFDARMHVVQALGEDITELKIEHARLAKLVAAPTEDLAASRAAVEKESAENERNYRIETGAIEERRKTLRNDQQTLELQKDIESRLQSNDAKRQSLVDEHNKTMAAIEERGRLDARFLNTQLAKAQKDGDLLRSDDIKQKLNAVNAKVQRERTRAEADYKRQRANLEEESRGLLQKRTDLVQEAALANKPQLEELTNQDRLLYRNYTQKRGELNKRNADLNAKVAASLEEGAVAQQRRDELAAQINRKERAFPRLLDTA
jgi:hypothetical protein